MTRDRRFFLKAVAGALSAALPSSAIAATRPSARLGKYASEILDHGREIVARGLAQEQDDKALKALSKPAADHTIDLELRLCANWHTRLGYYYVLANQPQHNSVRHGWSLQLLATLFHERALLDAARKHGRGPAPGQASVLGLFDCMFALCGQNALGTGDLTAQIANVVAACDVRRDFDVFSDEPTYRFPFELIRFLSKARPERADVVALESHLPFQGVSAAWEDDASFAALTQRWCEWHLDYSQARRERTWAHAVSPHDFLFPSWILAIARQREAVVGRPALGQHELIAYGTDLGRTLASATSAPPAVLLLAQKRYQELYGHQDYDFAGFWRRFLKDRKA